MLQHSGKAFFKVAAIDRMEGKIPTIYLDIYDRDKEKLIGQIRFNFDPTYSTEKRDIRMAFDVVKLREISPLSGGYNLLEDIIVGGILWVMMDNHYIFDFTPNVYMVVHSYDQDEAVMKDINELTEQVLYNIGAKRIKFKTMWKLEKENMKFDYVQKIINRH